MKAQGIRTPFFYMLLCVKKLLFIGLSLGWELFGPIGLNLAKGPGLGNVAICKKGFMFRSRNSKRIKRLKLLNELVPSRRCGICQIVKLESTKWVVYDHKAICKSCFMKGKK